MIRKLLLMAALCIGICNGRNGFAENANLTGKNYMYTPSAQAWQMIKYGDVDANLYTGTTSLSIPVYTYKDEDFEIPVSLDYSYNGLVPNQSVGMVGMGWNMTCGGVITREIRGIPDDFFKNGIYGFYHAHKHSESDFVDDPTDIIVPGTSLDEIINGEGGPEDLHVMGLNVNETFAWVLNSDKRKKFETEPDIFRFNFLGYSGAFMFGYDNQVFVFDTNVPFGEITVEIEDDTFKRIASGANSQSVIVLKTGNGYKYTFGGSVSAVDSSYTQQELSIDDLDSYAYEPDEMMIPPTAWHLSKIEAPNGKTVEFSYVQKRAIEPSYVVTTGQVMVGQLGPSSGSVQVSSNKEVFSYTYAAILAEVNVNDLCRIKFDYTKKEKREGVGIPWLEYPLDPYKEWYDSSLFVIPRLKTIKVEDIRDIEHPKSLKTCTLTQSYASGNPKMFLDYVTISGDGKYQMSYYDRTVNYPNLDTFAIDFWGYWNGRAVRETFIPECEYDRTSPSVLNNEKIIGNSRDAVFSKAQTGALKKIIYPTGGYSEFEYETHDYNHAVVRAPAVLPHLELTDKKETGGIRIRKITNYDGQYKHTREFSYILPDDNYMSSGNLLRMPRYRMFLSVLCYNTWQGIYAIELPGFNFRSMDATHIEYSDVYEKLTNGSVIHHHFSNYSTNSDSYNYLDEKDIWQTSIYNMSPSSVYTLIAQPYPSNHMARGKLLSKNLYDNRNQFVEGDSYEYTNHITGEVVSYGYAVDRFVGRGIDADNYTLYRHGHSKRTDDGQEFSQEKLASRSATSGQTEWNETTSTGQDTRRTYHFYADKESPALKALGIQGAKIAEVASIVHADGEEYLTGAVFYDYDTTKATDKPIAQRVALLPSPVKRNVSNWRTELIYFPELNQMTYDTIRLKYNAALRLSELELPGNRVTSYIWDKYDMYPIAKIENASIDQVRQCNSAFSGILMSSFASNVLTDAQIATLRTIPNSLTSIYQYIPFVGLALQEDPSGRKTFYEYDTDGRLSKIKDTDSRVVKEYNYHITNN